MRRLLLALATTAAATALAAFTHSEPQYSIDFPEGWDVTAADAQALVVAKPADGSGNGANCNSQYVPRPEMAAFTQEQINAEFSKPVAPEAWAGFVAMPPSDVKVSEPDAVDIGGQYLQIATLELNTQGITVIVRMSFVAMPGQIITVGCYAKPETIETYKALYDATVRSLKPV